jgi:hypothetical protein
MWGCEPVVDLQEEATACTCAVTTLRDSRTTIKARRAELRQSIRRDTVLVHFIYMYTKDGLLQAKGLLSPTPNCKPSRADRSAGLVRWDSSPAVVGQRAGRHKIDRGKGHHTDQAICGDEPLQRFDDSYGTERIGEHDANEVICFDICDVFMDRYTRVHNARFPALRERRCQRRS